MAAPKSHGFTASGDSTASFGRPELEQRITALEAQMHALVNNSAIKTYLDFERQQVAAIELGKRSEAPKIAAREAAEAELRAANVIWKRATLAPDGYGKGLTSNGDGSPPYARWGVEFRVERFVDTGGIIREQRIAGCTESFSGQLDERADAWLARLERESELAELIDRGAIVVTDVPRDEAIDLERMQRMTEGRWPR